MEIDARGLKDPEPLRLLRDALRGQDTAGKEITILVDSREEVKKVLAFSGFTGCLSDPEEKGDHWQVRITPMCNCG
jgi:TusA-related sulfurtransferase